MGELKLWNGSNVYADGADDGAYRIQGKNLRGAWCDEVGLWRKWEIAWRESLQFAVRHAPGRIIATGTPKRGNKLVSELIDDPAVPVTHMRTLDNAANLDEHAVNDLIARFQGTRLGRQELEGELLDDVPGALWTRDLIQYGEPPDGRDLTTIIVGVDPGDSENDDDGLSATGIVVAGFCAWDQRGYVLADYTCRGGPGVWARKVVEAFHSPLHPANLIVVEKNHGGTMVEHTIRTADRSVPIRLVSASTGKATRAEPVAMLYEQGRVFHALPLPELEDEMTTWLPDSGMESPNRMDALVWALTELMVKGGGEVKTVGGSSWKPPVVRRGDLVLVGERYVDKER